MDGQTFDVRPVGRVVSPLTSREQAPRQADEGAPPAEIVFDPAYVVAARDLHPGDEILLLTWLDRGRRDVLTVHPRGDTSRPAEGVFSTRSPDRPNPIGLHRVRIVSVAGDTLTVDGLEAIDGTPVLDIKPVIGEPSER